MRIDVFNYHTVNIDVKIKTQSPDISMGVSQTKPEEIEEKLKGNECGFKGTSCADQLAIAVRKAYNEIHG